MQNYTCAGASHRTGGAHVIDQVNEAAANGDIAGATVYMLAGANDTYPYILNDHMPVSEIQENLKNSIARPCRARSPALPTSRSSVCRTSPTPPARFINLIPDVNVPTFGVNISEVEWAMEQAGIDGAAAGGGRFVSLKAASEGHEMCSNDRYIVGIIDTTSTRRNLPLHMTDEGHWSSAPTPDSPDLIFCRAPAHRRGRALASPGPGSSGRGVPQETAPHSSTGALSSTGGPSYSTRPFLLGKGPCGAQSAGVEAETAGPGRDSHWSRPFSQPFSRQGTVPQGREAAILSMTPNSAEEVFDDILMM